MKRREHPINTLVVHHKSSELITHLQQVVPRLTLVRPSQETPPHWAIVPWRTSPSRHQSLLVRGLDPRQR